MNCRKIFTLCLAFLISVSALTACNSGITTENESKAEVETPDNNITISDETQQNPENIQNETNTPATEMTDNEEQTQEQVNDNAQDNNIPAKIINPLTGIETTEQLSTQRPIAIMMNNLKAALPQHGIAQMDVVYEAIVEGSITRLLGLVTDWSSLPTLGSIRSSRDYYIDFADAHDAIYVHAGGSELAYSALRSRKTNNIDGTNGTKSSVDAFYRNKDRLNNGYAREHTLFTSGPSLAAAISGNKYPTTLKEGFVSPFKFAETAVSFEGAAANYVYVPFSTYAQSYFDYNSESGVYAKGQYLGVKSSLDKHDSPHIDGNTNEQLHFKNIILMFTKYSTVDNAGRQAVKFTGTGKGYYITDGKCKEIVWERENRTSGYTLYEADGMTELLMNAGKTYIGMLNPNTKVIYK